MTPILSEFVKGMRLQHPEQIEIRIKHGFVNIIEVKAGQNDLPELRRGKRAIQVFAISLTKRKCLIKFVDQREGVQPGSNHHRDRNVPGSNL